MSKKERQKLIVERVMINRKASSLDLAMEFKVSEDTIRRDLNELDTKGLLSKVHGGAVSTIQKLYHYNEDAIFNRDKKNIAAKKAIPLLEDGMVAIISGGTTNLMLAKLLPKNLRATVYTYSLQIAMQLTEHPHIDIIFIGGKIQKKSMVTVGIDVFQVLSSIHADICFVGVSGLTVEQGITDEGYEIALIKKAMIKSSEKVVSLITANKLNVRQSYTVCPLNEIDIIVTDIAPDSAQLIEYAKSGVQIL
jgi:DeoR/GlpR family transcriptional regulator of sugar metabolism